MKVITFYQYIFFYRLLILPVIVCNFGYGLSLRWGDVKGKAVFLRNVIYLMSIYLIIIDEIFLRLGVTEKPVYSSQGEYLWHTSLNVSRAYTIDFSSVRICMVPSTPASSLVGCF